MSTDATQIHRSPSARIGEAAGRLLLDASWINRRKDSVQLLSDTYIRRQTSIDVTLGVVEPVSTSGSMPIYCVPLTLLGKVPRTLMRFDLSDDERERFPLPTRFQNGLASYAALCWAARRTLAPDEELPMSLRRELLCVALAPPLQAAAVSRALRTPGARPDAFVAAHDDVPELGEAENALATWAGELCQDRANGAEMSPLSDPERETTLREALVEDDDFVWLATKLADNSVVLSQFRSEPGARRILRLSYEENLYKDAQPRAYSWFTRLGWRAVPLYIDTPYAAGGSYHFEFETPDGVEIVGSRLVDTAPLSAVEVKEEDVDFGPRRGDRVHLYLPRATGVDDLSARMGLRVRSQAFAGGAALASAAIAAIFAFFAAFAPEIARAGASAPSFLLLFVGVFATVASRAGGHAMVVRMLYIARRLLLGSVGLAVIGAGALLVAGDGRTAAGDAASDEMALRVIWGALALLTGVISGMLFLTRILPRPVEGRLERGLFVAEAALRYVRYTGRHWRDRDLRLVIAVSRLDQPAADDLRSRSAGRGRVRARRGRRHPNEVRLARSYSGRPLRQRAAGRNDQHLRLHRSAAMRVSRTLKTAHDVLPQGFTFRATTDRSQVGRAIAVTIDELVDAVMHDEVELGAEYSVAAGATSGS